MKAFFVIAVLVLVALVEAQRPFYAGKRPIGYPELADRFKTDEDDAEATTVGLANRVGADGETTTTMRLPVDALGDRELVERISKWPVDKQPYWYINWKQIEAHRQRPQVPQPEVQSRSSFARPNNNW